MKNKSMRKRRGSAAIIAAVLFTAIFVTVIGGYFYTNQLLIYNYNQEVRENTIISSQQAQEQFGVGVFLDENNFLWARVNNTGPITIKISHVFVIDAGSSDVIKDLPVSVTLNSGLWEPEINTTYSFQGEPVIVKVLTERGNTGANIYPPIIIYGLGEIEAGPFIFGLDPTAFMYNSRAYYYANYYPSGYNLIGSTTYVSGSIGDLQSDDSVYMTFRSYASYDYNQVTFVSAGTGSGVAGDPKPAYPTGLQANDLILLQVTVRSTTATVTTPSGFTLLYGPDSTGTGRQWIYYKFATGSESGTITVDQSGTTCAIARMYAFRNVALTDFTEGGGFGTGTDASIEAQSVTTAREKRLAVSFVFVNDDNAVDSFTGESGGDWVEAVTEFKTTAGSDGCVQLQTATMASAGTISGGSYYMYYLDPWGVRAFALKPKQVTTYTSEVEFTGSATILDWYSVEWKVDSAWTASSVSVTLQFYNWATSSYPTSGDGYISYTSGSANVDQTQSESITVNPNNFREAGTGNWKIKVKGVKTGGSQFDFKGDLVQLYLSYIGEGDLSTGFEIPSNADDIVFYVNITNNSDKDIAFGEHSCFLVIVPEVPGHIYEDEIFFYLLQNTSSPQNPIAYSPDYNQIVPSKGSTILAFGSTTSGGNQLNVDDVLTGPELNNGPNSLSTENLAWTFLLISWKFVDSQDVVLEMIPYVAIHILPS